MRHPLLVTAAKALYDSIDACTTLLSVEGFTRVAGYELDDMRVVFARDGDADLCVINGTDSVDDWLKYNLRAALVPTAYGRIHSGFLKAAEVVGRLYAVWDSNSYRPVHVAGHSLGGAVAQVFAVLHWMQVASVTTFGQPRCGDKTHAKRAEELIKLTRYVFQHDFVTALPWCLGTYRHAGEPTQLGGSRAWWFLRALVSLIPKATGLTKLNHNIQQYVDALTHEHEDH